MGQGSSFGYPELRVHAFWQHCSDAIDVAVCIKFRASQTYSPFQKPLQRAEVLKQSKMREPGFI